MSKQPDGAFLFWARDWLTDEHVVLMSPAAKGVYLDLLCHCWLEGSIPACSEHLARIARIDAGAFAELWREIAPRFAEHPDRPGRLLNTRMERERVKAEDRRKARSDKAAEAARARWDRRRPDGASNAPRSARSNASASPVAMLADAHQTKPSTTPLPPSKGGGASRERQRPEPEPEPQKLRPRDDGAAPLADLTTALLATRFRAGITNAIRRRAEIHDEAGKLLQTGLTVELLADVWEMAKEKSSDDPGALLAHWLDQNLWREVLDERGRVAKERSAGAAAKIASANEDQLAGIYGGDATPAESVVGQVLAQVKAGGA